MANPDHVKRLTTGVLAWNRWRLEEPSIKPDLSGIEIGDLCLDGADLKRADLSGSRLIGSSFCNAVLDNAILSYANLCGADFTNASLRNATLLRANAQVADFVLDAGMSVDDLVATSLAMKLQHRGARSIFTSDRHWSAMGPALFRKANLTDAVLLGANLSQADFRGAKFNGVRLVRTNLADADLSGAEGLKSCIHEGPSFISYKTLEKYGFLPIEFLRGVGISEPLINNLHSLLEHSVNFQSSFISYSSKDQEFALRLYSDLQDKGVRCWCAPHDLPIGAKTWDGIDEAIRTHDKVLLILSRHAITSDWVEDEVSAAFAEERRRGVLMLVPVRLDDAIMETMEPWAGKLRENRNIGDFTCWYESQAYQKSLERVLSALRTER